MEIHLTDRNRLIITEAGELLFAAGPPYRAKIETLEVGSADALVRLAVPKVEPLTVWVEREAVARLEAWSAGRRPPPGTGKTADGVNTLHGEDRVRIELQHHEGPHDDEHHWVPRLVDVRSGEVILSLWGSQFGGSIELERPGAVRLLVRDGINVLYLEVDLDQRVIRVLSDQVELERKRAFVDDALWASPYRVVAAGRA